ncbi:MAG: hypothetical protein RhofKO_18490 [Rhodothermales bacterium]
MFFVRSRLSLYGQTLAFVIGVIVLALVGIGLFVLSINAQATKDRARQADRQLLAINSEVQQFLLTREMHHAHRADSSLVALMGMLHTDGNWVQTDTEAAYNALQQYDARLADLKQAIEARGVDENSGMEGVFRARVHAVESHVQALGLTDVEVHMLSARRSEKDFIMRERREYIGKVHAAIDRVVQASARATPSVEQHAAIEAGIRAYGATFDELVSLTFAITDAQRDLYHARAVANSELHTVIVNKTRRAEHFYTAAVWSVFATIAIGILVGLRLARSIVRPVRQVQAAAERIVQGKTNIELDLSARGELGKLATALDQVRVHVAKREQAQAAALEARQFAETVLAHVQTGVIVYDADLRFRLWNIAVEALTGIPSTEAVGRTMEETFPGVDMGGYPMYLARAQRGETVTYSEVCMTDASTGRTYWIEGSMAPFRAPDGVIKGVVATVHDVTERYQQVAALREAKQAAEVATRAKSEFVAMVSHELRTPLNGILGMASLMGTTALDDEQQEYLGIIDQCGDHLLGLIGQVLDFSHIESGHFNLKMSSYAPRELLHEVIHVVHAKAEQKGLELSLYLDRTVPSTILGDRRHVKQVLLNLLSNAVKFTEAGRVDIRLCCASSTTLRFEVEDTGIGIPPDKHEMVFSPFSQVDGSMSRAHEGTGLGLSISQRIAEQMGGQIYFESQEHMGSTFYFELPLEPAAVASDRLAA